MKQISNLSSRAGPYVDLEVGFMLHRWKDLKVGPHDDLEVGFRSLVVVSVH